jgi:hypothetical protein
MLFGIVLRRGSIASLSAEKSSTAIFDKGGLVNGG